jgi:hypothetical protein
LYTQKGQAQKSSDNNKKKKLKKDFEGVLGGDLIPNLTFQLASFLTPNIVTVLKIRPVRL